MKRNQQVRFLAIISFITAWTTSVCAQAPPVITNQPTSQLIVHGANVTLSVGASGSAILRYQWKKDGANLPGKTSSTLMLNNVQPADEGVYSVIVSNSYGWVTSSMATLGSFLNIQWQKSFGGNADEYITTVKETSDGGFILGGYSGSGASGNKTAPTHGNYDYWVMKLDNNGSKQWEQSFGGNSQDFLSALQQTSDGGYVIGGESDSGISGNKTNGGFGGFDYWVMKLDANGNKQWEQTFGGSGQEHFYGLQQTSEGGYLLAGESDSDISGNKTIPGFGGFDYWLIRLDASGNKLWEKVFGGDGDDHLGSLQKASDGGYVLDGQSTSGISGNKTNAGFGGNDFWTVKLDANVNKQWERSFEESYSEDYRVVCLDPAGTKLWDKSFGGSNSDILYTLQQGIRGEYILGGYSLSEISGDKTSPAYGNGDYWIVGLDSNGNKLWDRSFGGNSVDVLQSLQQTSDGAYVLGGYSFSGISGSKTSPSYGGYDYWVLKLIIASHPFITTQPQSQTNGLGSTVVLSVAAQNVSSYQWRKNGVNIFGATSSSLIFSSFQTNDIGRYDVVISPTSLTSVSAYLFVGGVEDVDPKIAVLSPRANGRITNQFAIAMTGTAKDSGLGVAQVFYKLNDSPFQLAQGTTAWSAPLTLLSGTNKVEVKCVDFGGNESKVIKRTFFAVVFSPLTLTQTGLGSIISTRNIVGTPTNLAMLEVGRSYKVKAVPGLNYIFSNWVGSATCPDAIYTFLMQSNMTLNANFIPNPFIQAAGKYNGLFQEPSGITHQTAGLFILTLKSNLNYTGRLFLDGDTIPISGKFSVNGTISRSISRAKQGKDNLDMALALDFADEAGKATGVVSTEHWASLLESDRAIFSNSNPATDYTNIYTMVIPGSLNSTSAPPGHGYGSIKLSLNGSARITGATGDGMKLGQSAPISKDGRWPLYIPLYKSIRNYTNLQTSLPAVNKSYYRGSLMSWVTFTNDAPVGVVSHIKTEWTNAIYPTGFTNKTVLIGSRYNVPTKTRAMDFTDGTVTLANGNLVSALARDVFLKDNNVFVITPTNNALKLTIAFRTGLINGSFQHPGNADTHTLIKGVVLQDQAVGAGQFLGTNQGGVMLIERVE